MMNKAALRKSEQVYGFLLKFYPKSYRQEFGEEMRYVFSESLKDAYSKNGEQGLFDLWVRIIADAGKSLIIQHLEKKKGGDIMKTKSVMQTNIFRALLVTAGLLMIPAVMTNMNSEWNWTLSDFAIMGVLLFSTGLIFQWAIKKAGKYKVAVGIAIILVFLYIWAELAVGIFTNLGS